jgi:hypothetical protein
LNSFQNFNCCSTPAVNSSLELVTNDVLDFNATDFLETNDFINYLPEFPNIQTLTPEIITYDDALWLNDLAQILDNQQLYYHGLQIANHLDIAIPLNAASWDQMSDMAHPLHSILSQHFFNLNQPYFTQVLEDNPMLHILTRAHLSPDTVADALSLYLSLGVGGGDPPPDNKKNNKGKGWQKKPQIPNPVPVAPPIAVKRPRFNGSNINTIATYALSQYWYSVLSQLCPQIYKVDKDTGEYTDAINPEYLIILDGGNSHRHPGLALLRRMFEQLAYLDYNPKGAQPDGITPTGTCYSIAGNVFRLKTLFDRVMTCNPKICPPDEDRIASNTKHLGTRDSMCQCAVKPTINAGTQSINCPHIDTLTVRYTWTLGPRVPGNGYCGFIAMGRHLRLQNQDPIAPLSPQKLQGNNKLYLLATLLALLDQDDLDYYYTPVDATLPEDFQLRNDPINIRTPNGNIAVQQLINNASPTKSLYDWFRLWLPTNTPNQLRNVDAQVAYWSILHLLGTNLWNLTGDQIRLTFQNTAPAYLTNLIQALANYQVGNPEYDLVLSTTLLRTFSMLIRLLPAINVDILMTNMQLTDVEPADNVFSLYFTGTRYHYLYHQVLQLMIFEPLNHDFQHRAADTVLDHADWFDVEHWLRVSRLIQSGPLSDRYTWSIYDTMLKLIVDNEAGAFNQKMVIHTPAHFETTENFAEVPNRAGIDITLHTDVMYYEGVSESICILSQSVPTYSIFHTFPDYDTEYTIGKEASVTVHKVKDKYQVKMQVYGNSLPYLHERPDWDPSKDYHIYEYSGVHYIATTVTKVKLAEDHYYRLVRIKVLFSGARVPSEIDYMCNNIVNMISTRSPYYTDRGTVYVSGNDFVYTANDDPSGAALTDISAPSAKVLALMSRFAGVTTGAGMLSAMRNAVADSSKALSGQASFVDMNAIAIAYILAQNTVRTGMEIFASNDAVADIIKYRDGGKVDRVNGFYSAWLAMRRAREYRYNMESNKLHQESYLAYFIRKFILWLGYYRPQLTITFTSILNITLYALGIITFSKLCIALGICYTLALALQVFLVSRSQPRPPPSTIISTSISATKQIYNKNIKVGWDLHTKGKGAITALRNTTPLNISRNHTVTYEEALQLNQAYRESSHIITQIGPRFTNIFPMLFSNSPLNKYMALTRFMQITPYCDKRRLPDYKRAWDGWFNSKKIRMHLYINKEIKDWLQNQKPSVKLHIKQFFQDGFWNPSGGYTAIIKTDELYIIWMLLQRPRLVLAPYDMDKALTRVSWLTAKVIARSDYSYCIGCTWDEICSRLNLIDLPLFFEGDGSNFDATQHIELRRIVDKSIFDYFRHRLNDAWVEGDYTDLVINGGKNRITADMENHTQITAIVEGKTKSGSADTGNGNAMRTRSYLEYIFQGSTIREYDIDISHGYPLLVSKGDWAVLYLGDNYFILLNQRAYDWFFANYKKVYTTPDQIEGGLGQIMKEPPIPSPFKTFISTDIITRSDGTHRMMRQLSRFISTAPFTDSITLPTLTSRLTQKIREQAKAVGLGMLYWCKGLPIFHAYAACLIRNGADMDSHSAARFYAKHKYEYKLPYFSQYHAEDYELTLNLFLSKYGITTQQVIDIEEQLNVSSLFEIIEYPKPTNPDYYILLKEIPHYSINLTRKTVQPIAETFDD